MVEEGLFNEQSYSRFRINSNPTLFYYDLESSVSNYYSSDIRFFLVNSLLDYSFIRSLCRSGCIMPVDVHVPHGHKPSSLIISQRI